MFDKIKLIADTENNDLQLIIETNNLKEVKRQTKISYDNIEAKNFIGMFMKIDIDKGSITIDGSLHKYFSNLQNNIQENHSQNFTIKEALQTFDNLSEKTNINFQTAKVKRLEIGLNLYVSKPPKEYINLIKSISPKGKKEDFRIIENPKYKDKSEIVSNMHPDNRKYYKVYDKVHELKDKRKSYPENINILRIETVWQRIDKLKVNELLHPFYLKDIVKEFVETWQSIEFERNMIVPKGLHQAKTQLIKEILQYRNTETLIENYRKQLATKAITERKFRTIREFIKNDWNELKTRLIFEPFEHETEFKKLLQIECNKNIN